MRILVTGSNGLIGTRLVAHLRRTGAEVACVDSALPRHHPDHGCILDAAALRARCEGVDGIVHLAAVARVEHAQVDPARCISVNLFGTGEVVEAARAAGTRPWILHASSREVYGEPERVPVTERHPIAPHNIYGRSKAEAERIVLAARANGLRTAILRFANVYGSVHDHPDRVVPAFCRAAATGAPIRVNGTGYTFDFTHVDDVVDGIGRTIALLQAGGSDLPPIHLASGRATTLEELASLARAAGGGRSLIFHAANRPYNVTCFVGDPARAAELLGWRATTSVEIGVVRLVEEFRGLADSIEAANASAGPAVRSSVGSSR